MLMHGVMLPHPHPSVSGSSPKIHGDKVLIVDEIRSRSKLMMCQAHFVCH